MSLSGIIRWSVVVASIAILAAAMLLGSEEKAEATRGLNRDTLCVPGPACGGNLPVGTTCKFSSNWDCGPDAQWTALTNFCLSPSNIDYTGGAVWLHATFLGDAAVPGQQCTGGADGGGSPFSSFSGFQRSGLAILGTHFRYGTYSVRALLPPRSTPGMWPSAVMYGTNCQSQQIGNTSGCSFWNPGSNEFDIMEDSYIASGLDQFAISSAFSPVHTGAFLNGTYQAPQWHVFKLQWSSTQMIFSIDGQPSLQTSPPGPGGSFTGPVPTSDGSFPIDGGTADQMFMIFVSDIITSSVAQFGAPYELYRAGYDYFYVTQGSDPNGF